MLGLLIHSQGTFCENGFNRDEDVHFEREASDNAIGYAATSALLMVQVRLTENKKPRPSKTLGNILRFLRWGTAMQYS